MRLVVRDKGKAPEKRKRGLTNGAGRASARRRTEEPEEDEVYQSDQYDPDQPIEEKRELQRGFRELLKDLRENADEYQQADSEGLHEAILRSNQLHEGVKQTTEAAIDAKFLVSATDAAYRKAVGLTAGNHALGVDVDEFVSKCSAYMRLGGGVAEDDAPELSSTQRQRRRPSRRSQADMNNYDDDGDDGDPFNWEHLGRFACLPNIYRPAAPGFLLGPLSVEKKVRKMVKRSAPFRPNNLTETRPEVLNAESIQKNENDLATVCGKILQRLREVQAKAQDLVEAAYNRDNEAEGDLIMERWGLRSTGGIDLMKFVINPHSFGQSVENMFYVSFLIRDGKIAVEMDDDGFPTLAPRDPDGDDGEQGVGKHAHQKQQTILQLDMVIWRDLIEEFEIKEPLIKHRQEQSNQGPGARGWYS